MLINVVPADSPEVRQRFESNLDLVETNVRQVLKTIGRVLPPEELRSFGQEGLLIAARRFDPERGVPFRKYAVYRIKGNMIDGMRTHGRLSRHLLEKLRMLRAALMTSEGWFEDDQAALKANMTPTAADERLAQRLSTMATAMAVGFTHSVAWGDQGSKVLVDGDDTPEAMVRREELTVLLNDAMTTLTEQEALFVRRVYYHDDNIDTVAEEIGLSRSWGSRILARATTKLHKRISAQL